MDDATNKDYFIQIKLFNFQKGSIIEDMKIIFNQYLLFSLIEAIHLKRIQSFGNTLIINEIKQFISTTKIELRIIVKNKDLEEESHSENLILSDRNIFIIEMKTLSVEIKFQLNSKSNVLSENKSEVNETKTIFPLLIIKNNLQDDTVFLYKDSTYFREDENKAAASTGENANKSNEFENMKSQIAYLESIYRIQNEKLIELEKLYIKQYDLIESEKNRFDKLEKKLNQIRMLVSPITIKYMFEYFISLAHKKFRFGY